MQGAAGCTFAQAPDEDECDGILAWHIREGNYGDVTLDGLNVVMVGSFEGNLWTGEAKNGAAGFFLDERADERQREALQMLFSGQAGGWPATFAALVESEIRGLEFVPIDFELADDLAHWRVEVPGKVRGSAEALTGPTSPEGGARRGPQHPWRAGRPWPSRDLGRRYRRRGRRLRLQMGLGRPLEQTLPVRLVGAERSLTEPRQGRRGCRRAQTSACSVRHATSNIAHRHTITLSALRSDHSTYTVDGNLCNHSAGRAMDIGAVDGETCRGTRTGACAALMRELAAVDGPLRATELIYCWDPDGPTAPRGFARADHCDHIHWGIDA